METTEFFEKWKDFCDAHKCDYCPLRGFVQSDQVCYYLSHKHPNEIAYKGARFSEWADRKYPSPSEIFSDIWENINNLSYVTIVNQDGNELAIDKEDAAYNSEVIEHTKPLADDIAIQFGICKKEE